MAIKNQRGFSLIEMVIYIAILVLMLFIISEVVFSIAKNNRVIKAVRAVELSAVTSLERMNREIRNADSIDTASSLLDVPSGALSLDGEDEAGTAYAIDFYLSGGRVRVRENGVDVGALTQASSTVTSLVFRRFSATSTEGVRIELTLENGTSTAYRSETFYSTVLLR